jgi:hypothetical protein
MPKFKAFHVTEIGASHVKDGKPCQDYSFSSEGKEYAVAIVCDGHGGNKYFRSDRGSCIATEQAHGAISQFMKSRFAKNQQGGTTVDTFLANPNTFMTQLAANIIYRWREAIAADFDNEPFTGPEKAILTDKELAAYNQPEGWVSAYGTTLIAVVRAKDFWFGLQIGDGKCVTVDKNGVFSQPIPWDEKCFLNMTTSLCDIQALAHFRYFFDKENLPVAIFTGSDGVDDTFGTEEALHGFYQTLIKLFAEKGLEAGVKELQDYLPNLSAKGSRDDISIAGILVLKTHKTISRINKNYSKSP